MFVSLYLFFQPLTTLLCFPQYVLSPSSYHKYNNCQQCSSSTPQKSTYIPSRPDWFWVLCCVRSSHHVQISCFWLLSLLSSKFCLELAAEETSMIPCKYCHHSPSHGSATYILPLITPYWSTAEFNRIPCHSPTYTFLPSREEHRPWPGCTRLCFLT